MIGLEFLLLGKSPNLLRGTVGGHINLFTSTFEHTASGCPASTKIQHKHPNSNNTLHQNAQNRHFLYLQSLKVSGFCP